MLIFQGVYGKVQMDNDYLLQVQMEVCLWDWFLFRIFDRPNPALVGIIKYI